MKYRITFRNHVKALEFFILFLIIIIAFVWYQSKQSNLDDTLINGLIVFIALSFLPVFYLHLEYYSHNKNSEIEIDVYEKKIIYTDRTGTIVKYSFDDLYKIVINMSPNMHRGSSFQILPFEQYHYAKIYTKSGKNIIITCLIAQRVQDVIESIKGVPIEKRKRLFASILMDRK